MCGNGRRCCVRQRCVQRRMAVLVGQRFPRRPTRSRYSGPSRHSRSKRRTPTSSFRAQSRNPCPLPTPFPKYPQHSNFVIPCAVAESISPAPTFSEVPAAPQLRHSARSRGIHLPLPMLQPEKPAPSARHHGYCEFAQYGGAGSRSGSYHVGQGSRYRQSTASQKMAA